MTDKEIYLAAQAVIKTHGDGAALHAAQRADELMADGDMEGRRVWHRIGHAIRDLQRAEPATSERVH